MFLLDNDVIEPYANIATIVASIFTVYIVRQTAKQNNINSQIHFQSTFEILEKSIDIFNHEINDANYSFYPVIKKDIPKEAYIRTCFNEIIPYKQKLHQTMYIIIENLFLLIRAQNDGLLLKSNKKTLKRVCSKLFCTISKKNENFLTLQWLFFEITQKKFIGDEANTIHAYLKNKLKLNFKKEYKCWDSFINKNIKKLKLSNSGEKIIIAENLCQLYIGLSHLNLYVKFMSKYNLYTASDRPGIWKDLSPHLSIYEQTCVENNLNIHGLKDSSSNRFKIIKLDIPSL